LYSLSAAIQAVRRGTAFFIERAAVVALAALAVTFAVDVLSYPLSIGGQRFTNLEALQLAVIGLWIAHHLLSVNEAARWRSLPPGLTIAVGLWMVALAISTLLVPFFRDATVTFDSRVVRGVLLAWITFDMTGNRLRWQMMIRCFALSGFIVYAFGLAEAANIAPIRNWLVDVRGVSIFAGELLRLSSTLSYPNIAAIVIEMTLFPVLAWMTVTREHWLRFCLGVVALAGLVSLVLTYSRAGLIAFLLSLFIVAALALYYRGNRGQRRAILLGGASVVAALFIAVVLLTSSNRVVALRFTTEDDQSWYQVAFAVADQVSARPGDSVTIPVTVTNTGPLMWQASGNQAIFVSYHLLRIYPAWRMGLQYDGQRTTLPDDVPPGGSVTVAAQVVTPTDAGEYLIQWDMIQENVTWFSAKSSPTADTRLSLNGEPVGGSPFEVAPFDDIPHEPSPSRLTLWGIAFHIAQEHPWFGVGPDNFRQT